MIPDPNHKISWLVCSKNLAFQSDGGFLRLQAICNVLLRTFRASAKFRLQDYLLLHFGEFFCCVEDYSVDIGN